MLTTDLYKITLTLPLHVVEPMAELLEHAAVSVAILGTPDQATREVEAIYSGKPNLKNLTAELSVLAALFGLQPPRLKLEELPSLNWVQKVTADHPPLEIGRWVIHSAAYAKKLQGRRNRIQIDVTNAFGTGEHPTTRRCLMMLDWLLRCHPEASRWHMLDVGCGTAILSMAFAQAARGRVLAVDLDPAVVKTAGENVRLNGLQSYILTGQSRGLMANIVKSGRPYNLVMANIFKEPLCRMAKDVKQALQPGGYAIISGILHYQANAVLAAYHSQGLRLLRRFNDAGWIVFLLKRD